MRRSILGISLLVGTCLAVAACSGGGSPAKNDSTDGGGQGGAPASSSGGTASVNPNVSECPEPTGDGTVVSSWLIDTDQTWTAAGSPYYIRQNTSIRGATVTIEKCAVVALAEGVTLEVGDSSGAPAKLIARGEVTETSSLPVLFTAEDETKYFTSLWISATGEADLEGTILNHGGNVTGSNANGTIVVEGKDALPLRQNLRMVASAVVNSAGFGIHLRRNTGFTDDSNGLVIESSGLELPTGAVDTFYPLFVTTGGVATIPSGTYTKNEHPAILVYGGDRYPADVTFHDRGVPYRFQSDLHVEPDDETPITLTLEAGTRLEFEKGFDGSDARFAIALGSGPSFNRPVTLVANGTSTNPIVLTSAEASPAAGDWIGINWGGSTPTGNSMAYVTIDYAGADSLANGFGCGNGETNAALIIRDWIPDGAFVTNSTFSNSAGGGIISGWSGVGPNLRSSNTFENIEASFCEVSQPKDMNGLCPGADSVPDCY